MKAKQPILMGDKVFLKSGGHPMTVTNFAEGKVLCSWFEKDWNGEPALRVFSFDPNCLVLAEDVTASGTAFEHSWE